MSALAPRAVVYGEHPAQVCDLHLPAQAPRAVAILVHGGFWRARYDRGLEVDVAADLVARGWAVWNVDYRGVEGPGLGPGGWPGTYEDVAAAVDLLADVGPGLGVPAALIRRSVVVGHSAGGALALWTAGRHRLPPGAPGAGPRVRPRAVVAQAAVCDLVTGDREGLGRGAVSDVMGGTATRLPAAYALASPAALLPLGVPMLLVTGADDDTVPPSQSVAFAAAATAAGDDVTLEVVPGEGHDGHLEPGSGVWAAAVAWLGRLG